MGCDRFIFNHILGIKKFFWDECQENISKKELSEYITDMKTYLGYDFFNIPDRAVLTTALDKVFVAYKNFFEGRTGFPKY